MLGHIYYAHLLQGKECPPELVCFEGASNKLIVLLQILIFYEVRNQLVVRRGRGARKMIVYYKFVLSDLIETHSRIKLLEFKVTYFHQLM